MGHLAHVKLTDLYKKLRLVILFVCGRDLRDIAFEMGWGYCLTSDGPQTTFTQIKIMHK